MRHRVKSWSSPFLSSDRKHLWIRAELDNAPAVDLELPFEVADQLVSAFAQAGQLASREAGDDTIASPDFSGEQWEVVPVRGLAFSLGRHPGETALVVDLFRFRLALSLDSKTVAAVGASFARTAATLSADPERPN
jgi:hypothetical protein